MSRRILIANRGEIACRIMRNAKSMGIATREYALDFGRNEFLAEL